MQQLLSSDLPARDFFRVEFEFQRPGRVLPRRFRMPWRLAGDRFDLNDAHNVLEATEHLAHGETGTMRIYPYVSPHWTDIKPGDQIDLCYPVEPCGRATVLERVTTSEGAAPLDRVTPIGPLELKLLSSGIHGRMLDSMRLPNLAAGYLVLGLDSAPLALLAGLDVGRSVNVYDAREHLADFLGDLDQTNADAKPHYEACALLAASLHRDGLLSSRKTTKAFYRLAAQWDYESPLAQIGELYDLDVEWDSGWGRSERGLHATVGALCAEVVEILGPRLGRLDRNACQRLSALAF